MNRRSRKCCKGNFSKNKKEFFFLRFNELLRSAHFFDEAKENVKEADERSYDFFLHVLIGFLLYGAFNEQSIFYGSR